MSGPASGGASPSGSAQTKDFFISYTGTNVDWAAWIAHELEAAGYTTVYQHRDFGAGGVFILQMHEAMRTTKHTIAVLSPEYLLSGYTQAEWAEAVRRDPTGKHRLLLPVRVRDCKPDGMFGARVYCDLVGLNETGARERLLVAAKEVAVELPPPVSAPEVSLPPVQLQPITPAQHAVLTKKPSEPHRENVFGFFGVLPVGTLVNDRFRVKKLLGQGVQSNVYLVEDEARLFGNRFALKESLSSTVSERRQFNREVKWLLGLDHPNLPAVIAQFEWNNRPYFAMAFVDGENLEALVDRMGPLQEGHVLSWIRPVADAVSYLHTQKRPIIHRDIKPGNIIVTKDGRPFLVDFGIAKVITSSLWRNKTTRAARAVSGGYSPLEQYTRGGTDARSDVYALGATLYHLLTGVSPPEAPDIASGVVKLPEPHLFNRKISHWTEQVILKAMQQKPEDRFQSVRDLLNTLPR